VCAAGEEIDVDLTTTIQILRDFKPIFELDLYGEHILRKELRGQKLTDLSAGSTYTRVYRVCVFS